MSVKNRFSIFLKQLPFIPIFQLGVMATIAGLIVGDWFCTTVLKLSDTGRMLAWVVTFGSSLFFGTTVCYQRSINATETSRDSTGALKQMIQNVVTLTPLLVSVALAIKPLIYREYLKSSVILWTAIALWCAIKILFRRPNWSARSRCENL
jgi:hypothetical protein